MRSKARRDPKGPAGHCRQSNHRLADVRVLDFGKLERESRGDVGLLMGGLAQMELARLAVVIGNAPRTDAALLERCF